MTLTWLKPSTLDAWRSSGGGEQTPTSPGRVGGPESPPEGPENGLRICFSATGRIKMDQFGGGVATAKGESVTLVALNLLDVSDKAYQNPIPVTLSPVKDKKASSSSAPSVYAISNGSPADQPSPPTTLTLRTRDTVNVNLSVASPSSYSALAITPTRHRGILGSPFQPSCFQEEDEDNENNDDERTPLDDQLSSPRNSNTDTRESRLSKSLNSGGVPHGVNSGTVVGGNGTPVAATTSGFSLGSCWPSGSTSNSSSSSNSSGSSTQLPPRYPRRRTPSLPADPSLSGLAHKRRDDILLHCSLQRLPMKDFGAEVRASMDVDQFLNQAVLLLDVQDTSVEGIVDRMLQKVSSFDRSRPPQVLDSLDSREPLATMTEAKEALFAHDSGDTEIGKNHVHLLGRTIQGTYVSEGGGFDYDQSWICAMCGMPSLLKRHVAIARLKHPANMGRTSHEVRFFIMVLTPSKEKGTKNALETGRTFATIFADMDFRQRLLEVHTEAEFKNVLLKHAQDLAAEQSNPTKRLGNHDQVDFREPKCRFAQGLTGDARRRLAHYFSDYIDGFKGHRTIQKTVSTTFFLYFACLLPTIAFGVLNDTNTYGKIGDVRKSIIGQAIGGLIFATIAGQPLVIVMTTAPLSLYIKVIHGICEDFQLNFFAMYACVGLWNTLFLILYAIFDASKLMKWSTRSTEEIFALFISIAFAVDAGKDMYRNFRKYYYSPACTGEMVEGSMVGDVVSTGGSNQSSLPVAAMLAGNLSLGGYVEGVNGSGGMEAVYEEMVCKRENSLLFLLLMLGTVWLAISLFNFNKTPYLQASRREMLADYALPVAVILLSFIGSYVFKEIKTDHFRYTNNYPFVRAPVEELPWTASIAAMGLGFALSLLFFMDQNISAAMVNNPCNKLKKGPAYHLDLLVIGLINGFLSIYGFPWMHGVLPHSPLHVRSLADVEERVDQGHVYEIIVKVRETRITGIVSHILIGLSVFLLPLPLAWIPTPVLYGLFLYMAITSLNGNQMFERITLLFMEQAAYPPNHYIRRCPQRKIHLFTIVQVAQLSVMCFFGFAPWPYVEMVFPVVILLLLPFRHTIVPYIINEKYLEALDGENQ